MPGLGAISPTSAGFLLNLRPAITRLQTPPGTYPPRRHSSPALPAPESQEEETAVTDDWTQDSLPARYLAEQSGRLLIHFLEAVLLIAALFLLLALFLFCRSALRRRSYRRLDAAGKLENRMRKVLLLGEMQDLRLEAGETPGRLWETRRRKAEYRGRFLWGYL